MSLSSIFFVPINVVAQQYNLLQVVARPGDSAASLLALYQAQGDCNAKFFYTQNNISPQKELIANKVYQLPIYVASYNKKSIRTTLNISDLEQAKRIQAYNEEMYKNKLQASDYRKTNMLWILYSEIGNCNEIKTSTTSPKTTSGTSPNKGTRNFPIFGEKHKYVPLNSSILKGCVFYIDAGHGGPDPGAIGKYNNADLCEDEYAYDVSLRLARNLLSNGAIAYMITRDSNDGIREGEILPCDTDETCWDEQTMPYDQKERLTQRADAINQLYELHALSGAKHQRLVSIHVDSRSHSARADLFFYYYPNNADGKNCATTLLNTVKKKYEQFQSGRGYEGTVEDRDLFMLRETEPTAVYIELGNIQNKLDQKRIILESNRQALADWLYEGLLQDAK